MTNIADEKRTRFLQSLRGGNDAEQRTLCRLRRLTWPERLTRKTSCSFAAMLASLKRTFTRTGLRNLGFMLFLVAAGIGVFSIRPTRAEIRTGRCGPCFGLSTRSENFDGVTPPALPQGWLATNALGPPPLWVTSNNGVPTPPADTSPNAAFIDDPAVVSDKRLDSPSFVFFEGFAPQLTFRHNFILEASDIDPNVGFDGAVLEQSTDGGNTFQEVPATAFVIGGYNRTISTDRGSPIAGRQAWSGNSGGFITTVVNLPLVQVPPGVILRWRMASDNSGSGEGWRVDTVTVSWCHGPPGCTPVPLPTPRHRPTPAPRPSPG